MPGVDLKDARAALPVDLAPSRAPEAVLFTKRWSTPSASSTFRVVGTPSSSKGVAPGPSRRRPSSTSPRPGAPTCSPSLSANRLRCFCTASADRPASSTPIRLGAAMRSNTTGTVRVGGLVAPSTLGRLGRHRLDVQVLDRARAVDPVPHLRLAVLGGQGRRVAPCPGQRQRSVDPLGGGDRDLDHRVAVARRLDLADLRVGRPGARLEVQGELDLPLGRDLDLPGVEKAVEWLEGGGVGEDVARVLGRHLEVGPRLGEAPAQAVLAEVGGVGVAQPALAHDPDPHAGRGGGGEPLDLALEGVDPGPGGLLGICLDALAAGRLTGQPLDDLVQLDGHAAPPVPPTVMRAIRMVGAPLPTGTPWPSLPQMPSLTSKSLPRASIAAITLGPSPTRLAPRTGVVTSPFSIR